MTFLRLFEWMVMLASVHRQPGWVILLAIVAFASLQWLRRRIWRWRWE